MDIKLTKLTHEHAEEGVAIFNYYIENTMYAYPENKVSNEFFQFFIESSTGLASYAIFSEEVFIGFGLLRKHNPMSSFDGVAEVTYFIHHKYINKGAGKVLLTTLIEDGKRLGLRSILASISSRNAFSLSFHSKHGFIERGRFVNIGKKNDEMFDVVWMQKML